MRRLTRAPALLATLCLVFVAACSQIHHERGAGLYVQHRYFESEYHLKQTLASDPTDANAALLLSVVYLKTYREKQAEPILRQLAQSETPEPVDAAALPEFAGMSASAAAKQLLGQPQRNSAEVGDLEEQILREHSLKDVSEQTRPSAETGKTKNKKTAAPNAPGASPATESSSGKAFGVHILSVHEPGKVNQAAATLKAKLPKLFANKEVRSRKADLGAKGVFYRVLLGPYATRKEAENVCVAARKAYSFCEALPF